eukprot:6116609-Karenia_brevis.AAC.1
MQSLGATPRTLADDLLLTTTGSRALNVFKVAFNKTIEHMIDLGGRLSPQKSNLLPHSKHQKSVFARVCANAKALYGCESSHVDESSLRSYTSQMLKTISTSNQLHARS